VKSIIDATYERVCEAHFSVIHQLAAMRQYVDKHLQELREKNQECMGHPMPKVGAARKLGGLATVAGRPA
jgi:hypothetical protein